jgi:zinc protease
MKKNILFYIAMFSLILSCDTNNSNQYRSEIVTDSNGFSYEAISNDPTGLRLYTLDNGLTVYLSKNIDEPKIQTFIAVRAGSNYDPKESTGLAHYLEHMVFKGTSKIGTIDWDSEKVYLDKISDLYETHRAEVDIDKKLAIYKEIDAVSLEASSYSIANEYDKMTSSLGATGTNAHTWFEETVYKNKIPANELSKWLILEEERFSELVLRLFHTELEAVFEEFNRGQDNDGRKSYAAMLEGLFPNHPYGQQKTIGTAQHLKNPSLIDINNYFDKYYVPNNMAMVLVGDINFEETILEVSNTFGNLKRKEVVHPILPKEENITSVITKEVFGPTAENVNVAFRSDGISTKEEKLVTLCDMILSNGNAGLIDLNLNQKQLVQGASCSPTFLNDYGYHSFSGIPKEGQSLDEVRRLILDQINLLKQGEFDEWMIQAVVNDMKKSQLQQFENSTALASAYYSAFIHHEKWRDKIQFLEDLSAISKQELVDFANGFYQNNYVVTYKRKGEDNNIVKVSNPGITPVELNRSKSSDYMTKFNTLESKPLTPVYVNYDSAINKVTTSNGMNLSYIENQSNDLFDLNIIFDMGSDSDNKLGLAVGYLDYLGTDNYSAKELRKEFYKLGIDYYVSTQAEQTYVGLSGLKDNLSEGLELLEHLWDSSVADQESYNNYVAAIAKERQNNKTSKGRILRSGLLNYAIYGENSRLRNVIPVSELKAINPKDLVKIVKDLKNYKQRLFYYGKDVKSAITAIDQFHSTPAKLIDYPEPINYIEKETGGNVYYVDYDMVQSEMMFIAKGAPFKAENMAVSLLFNTYFGGGLSSIIFQEIRESKSLAYSAWSNYSTASKKENSNYVMAYIGTQSNKMPEAVEAMMELMNNMPEAKEQFNAAKESTLKQLASQRITKSNIFWNYERLQKIGIETDNREVMYNAIKKMKMVDLRNFFNENIKGENYNVMVIGNEKDLDFKALNTLGKVQKMDVDYLFNYEKPGEIKL